jgi:hypothetical protein
MQISIHCRRAGFEPATNSRGHVCLRSRSHHDRQNLRSESQYLPDLRVV